MKRLESLLVRGNNNFDLIRLLAALAVIFGHSFSLFKSNGYIEPIRYVLKTDYSGSLAVYIFFFLSGIFITKSFLETKPHNVFLIMRFFRIWPALIVCVFLTSVLVGPLISKYNIVEYFRDKTVFKYIFCNIFLYNIKFNLPGVFENNFYPNAVNGSLWTLPFEVRCYCITFVLGLSGVFKYKWLSVLVFSIMFVGYFFNLNIVLQYLNKPCLFFIAGSLVCVFRNYIYIDYRIFIGLLFFCAFFYSMFMFYVVLCYGVVFLASSKIFKSIKLPGDYSYGIYIYGFLVQQILAHFYPFLTSYGSLFISIFLTTVLAVLSWHLIEQPSLKFGRSISRKTNFN